ncbi:hypothetical protein JCM10207_003020 [Rhodosporidiobolus poonsookiae]
MSSSSDFSNLPSNLTLAGGIPLKNPDFGASIAFLVLYILCVPLALYRAIHPASRTWVLLRPCIVIAIRIATYIIRIIEANGNYSEGLFIADQVLLLTGLIPLCEPLVALLKAHIRRNWIPKPPVRPDQDSSAAQDPYAGLNRLLRLLSTLLLVALVLGIYSGTLANKAIDNADDADTLKHMRIAISAITLVIVCGTGLIALALQVREGLPVRGTAFLILVAALLALASAYKLDTALHPVSSTSHGAKTAFYLLSCLPELLAILLYLSINLDVWFDVRESAWKDKVAKRMRKGKWDMPTYVHKTEYRWKKEQGHVEMGTLQGPKA